MPKKKKIKPKTKDRAVKSRSKVKRLPPLKMYRKISLSFILGSAILFVLALYLVLMRAEIVITPTRQEINVDLIVDIETAERTASDAVRGFLSDITLGESGKYLSRGESVEVLARAEGKVTIYNNLSRNQTLVTGTRMLSPEEILFRTKKRVDIPAGGSIEVEVYADQPGKESEIGPAYFTIPGLWKNLQDKVFAKSDAPMTGGIKELTAISQEDIDRAGEDLTKKIFEEARKKISEGFADKAEARQPDNASGEFTGIVYTYETLEKESSEEAGSQKADFTMRIKLHTVGVGYDSRELNSRASAVLAALVPVDKKLIDSNLSDLRPVILKYNLPDGTANLKISLLGQLVLKESSPILDKNKLVGLSYKEAVRYLERFKEISKAEIRPFPFWLKTIPKVKDRVKIIIQP